MNDFSGEYIDAERVNLPPLLRGCGKFTPVRRVFVLDEIVVEQCIESAKDLLLGRRVKPGEGQWIVSTSENRDPSQQLLS